MPSPKSEHQPALRRLNDGRIYVREFTPPTKEIKTAGGILIPTASVRGEGYRKVNEQHQEVIVELDKSCVYGRVTACGMKANRSNCVAVPKELQGDFPLPPGTWVKISGSAKNTAYKVSAEEMAYNTWDVQEWVLPSEGRPEWAPEE